MNMNLAATTTVSEAQTLFLQGCELMEAGALPDAIACFEKAILFSPDYADAHVNLGLLLDRQGDAKSAEARYRRAIEIDPGHAEACLNLGALLANHKRFDAAEAALQRAIDLKPHAANAWTNLGVLYTCMKRETEAERCHRTAIFLNPGFNLASFNLSYLLLSQGRFEEGWQRLESRNWYRAMAEHLSVPRWCGEDLTGKSLLICFEAGFGDVIQFCRYASMLKARGAASITLICHPPLKSLLADMEGLDSVIGYDEPIASGGWDFWTPLLSIPGYCNTRLESIPAAIPYLHAQKDLIEKWAARLPQGGLRVGLAWKGNPLFENDADRSLPSIDLLAPLWSVQGVVFVGLQKGRGEEEMPPCGLPLTRLGAELSDFSDTAALIACLDLVISVDTAVAHLAGALGKPVWVLLPDYKPDWRWLKERADTPWYPGVMRLYRQQGDWTAVIADLTQDLSIMAIRTRPASA